MNRWFKALSVMALGAAPALAQAPATAPAPAAQPARSSELKLGPIDDLGDIEATLKLVFKLADADNNNAISQQEAITLGNILAGGAFFAADLNGDGILTEEEVQAARQQIFEQRPLLKYVVQRAEQDQQASGEPGLQKLINDIGTMLDTNQDKQLQATEVRQAVQTAVQTVFAAGDANRDGQLTPDEVQTAGVAVANLIAQGMFQAVDTNNDGQISREEYLAALAEPAEAGFAVLDANADGHLSPEELQRAQQVIVGHLRNLRVPDTTRASGYDRSVTQPAAGATAPATVPATTITPTTVPAQVPATTPVTTP